VIVERGLETMNQQRPVPPASNVQGNPFLKGFLWASNDPGAIPHALSMGYKVIALVDVGSAQYFPNCSVVSSLLPPPNAIAAIINGDLPTGIALYKQYLFEEDKEEIIAVIIGGILQRPQNFLIYTEFDSDKEFHILSSIQAMFWNTFGIYIGQYGDETNPARSVFDPLFAYRIADTLFAHGFINFHMYSQMIPPMGQAPMELCMPSPRACGLILQHVNYGFNTFEDCMRACMGMIANAREEAATGRINPMVAVRPNLSKDALMEIQKREVNLRVMDNNPPKESPKKEENKG